MNLTTSANQANISFNISFSSFNCFEFFCYCWGLNYWIVL